MNDLLSDVLRAVRLSGAIFFSIDARGPWAFKAPSIRTMAPLIRPGIDHVIQFHAIVSGRCWGGVLDAPQVELASGDVLLLPRGDAHSMSSSADERGVDVPIAVDANVRPAMPMSMKIDGDGDPVRVICGYLGCDARPFNPLLSTLPRQILIGRAAEHVPLLAQLVELAVAETRSSGAGRD